MSSQYKTGKSSHLVLKFGTCSKFNKNDLSINVRIRINKAELELAIPEGKG